MERALVVVDSSESSPELVREAGKLAAGVGSSLVVCSVVDQDEIDQYDEMIGAIERTEQTSYGVDVRETAATKPARDIAEEVLGNVDVKYQTTGIVADPNDCAPQIVDLATELDCDHVFIAGRQRSPTGKAMFGDTAQRVILNFPHPVTIVTS